MQQEAIGVLSRRGTCSYSHFERIMEVETGKEALQWCVWERKGSDSGCVFKGRTWTDWVCTDWNGLIGSGA